MTDYDNRGQVSLWKPQSDNPKAPAARGTIVAHRDIREGEEIEIALWRNQSDNPRAPLMKGKISDRRDAQQPATTPSASGGDDLDSDIPFASFERGTVA
jgi:hypothetical protein